MLVAKNSLATSSTRSGDTSVRSSMSSLQEDTQGYASNTVNALQATSCNAQRWLQCLAQESITNLSANRVLWQLEHSAGQHQDLRLP